MGLPQLQRTGDVALNASSGKAATAQAAIDETRYLPNVVGEQRISVNDVQEGQLKLFGEPLAELTADDRRPDVTAAQLMFEDLLHAAESIGDVDESVRDNRRTATQHLRAVGNALEEQFQYRTAQ